MTVIHVPALPHVILGDPMYSWCAYSAKVMRFPAILNTWGVFTYAPRGSFVYKEGTEMQGVLTKMNVHEVDQEDLMIGETGNPKWQSQFFTNWEPNSSLWREWNSRCAKAIRENYVSGDIIGIIAGSCQQAIVDEFPNSQVLEWGIGYRGVMPQSWAVFESNAWRSAVRGANEMLRSTDVVIPNSWFASEFRTDGVERKTLAEGGYLAYLGRVIEDKGMGVLRHLTDLGYKVKLAGQGDPNLVPKGEYQGILDPYQKARFMAGAVATLVPTMYHEPFGGVSIESLFCGTPVIATHGAVFPETVGQLSPGMLANRLSDWVENIELWDSQPFPPQWYRRKAQQLWSVQAVRPKYERLLRYMEDVRDGAGWMKL